MLSLHGNTVYILIIPFFYLSKAGTIGEIDENYLLLDLFALPEGGETT
jgi:hypothetical protein